MTFKEKNVAHFKFYSFKQVNWLIGCFSASVNIFRLSHLSAVWLFLLYKVQFQISVVLLSWLLVKLKSVWLTLSESCSSCEHNPQTGWWGHTGILLGALVGLIKKFMLKCQPGPEPDKGPPQSKDLHAAWQNFTVLLSCSKLVDNHLLHIMKNGLI